MPPIPVYWLIQAQDQLMDALGKAVAEKGPAPLVTSRNKGNDSEKAVLKKGQTPAVDQVKQYHDKRVELDDKLRRTFANQKIQEIIVVERLGGFQNKAVKHVLRVELTQGDKTLARVVKIGESKKLTSEWKNWNQCERPANDRGRAFMKLSEGAVVKNKRAKQYESLIYEDAQQTLRAAQVLSFEQAALSCCRWNVPSVDSMLNVLDQIYAELIDRLYRRAGTAEINKGNRKAIMKERNISQAEIREAVRKNNSLPYRCCKFARDVIGENKDRLSLDLFDFHRLVLSNGEWPEMQIGPAHGDLHGRNILVGLVDGEARWPAVYDYEDMGLKKWLAWDFVKLEHEFKVRALPLVFPVGNHQFIELVHAFEADLSKSTEELNNGPYDEWTSHPLMGEAFSGWCAKQSGCSQEKNGEIDPSLNWSDSGLRLRRLLLGIRRQAKKCLEIVQGRGRRWLHEYYFTTAFYGLYVNKFPTYSTQNSLASYVCASYCAYRYYWSNNRLHFSKQEATRLADEQIMLGNLQAELNAPENVSYEVWLAFAKPWVRTREQSFIAHGVELLKKLYERFPGIAEIVQELAFAFLQLLDVTGNPDYERQAVDLIFRYDREQEGLYASDTELQARIAKVFKLKGDVFLDKLVEAWITGGVHPNSPDQGELDTALAKARPWYDKALYRYQCAYDHNNQDPYPGINVSSLMRMKGDTEAAKKLAQDIYTLVLKDPNSANEWKASILCEAAVVLEQYAGALDYCRQADAHKEATKHSRCTLACQCLRIRLAQGTRDKVEELDTLLIKMRAENCGYCAS